ncbi:unnamed protein product [Diamesa hyperborea]
MAAFQIYCDKENSNERFERTDSIAPTFPHDLKKEQRQKLLALTNLPNTKTTKSLSSNIPFGGTFKQKNCFVSKDDEPKIKQQIREESVDDVSFDTVDILSSTRRTLREINKHDDSFTPMSVIDVSTPMSIDKSNMEMDHDHSKDSSGSSLRNERERFFEVVEYQKDILQYLKQTEVQKNFRPRPEYMKKQPDINDSMRAILVDWLVEVSEEYRLQSETLCLAVNYIDRFLSFMSVVRAKLQLVGTAAMFIASKYEEIYPPEITEFVYITDDTYTKQQVLRMEKLLLKVLSFDLCAPSALSFINLYTAMMSIPEKIKFMAQYLCELSLLTASPYLNYAPSKISAAAIALSFYTMGMTIWNKKMETTFGYEIEELKELIIHLNDTHHEAAALQQQAIQDKYKASKYLQVSQVPPKKITRDELDEMLAKTDILDSTLENIENVTQKTSSILFN